MPAAPILIRNHAFLAKVEATSGLDAAPTALANAIKVSNLSITPLEVQTVARSTSQPYLGNTQKVMVAGYTRTEFDVELAGSGAAGTAPQMAPLLIGCGFAETISAGISAVYKPISDLFKTLTLYTNIGGVLYKTRYVAGSPAININALGIPQVRFSFTGLYDPVTDQALPSNITYRDVTPVGVNKDNTQFTLHGYAAVMNQLTLDLKNQVQYRNLVNFEGVRITDRQPDGSVRFEATKVADKDWFAAVRAATQAPLSLVHGSVAGNIVQIDAPKAQITTAAFDDDNGIQMFRGGLSLQPDQGNDELVLTFK